jgi:hypothetical protein
MQINTHGSMVARDPVGFLVCVLFCITAHRGYPGSVDAGSPIFPFLGHLLEMFRHAFSKAERSFTMSHGVVGLAVALLGGVLVGFINYLLTGPLLRRKASLYAAFSVVRQILHIGYLVALYLAAPYTPWDRLYLLIGGVLGMTVSMAVFTAKLVRLSDRLKNQPRPAAGEGETVGEPSAAGDSSKESKGESGKGEDSHG